MHRVRAVDPSAEQIRSKPAAVLALGTERLHLRGGEDAAAVLGVDQLGLWLMHTNRLHGESSGLYLIQQGMEILGQAALVRVPMTVQAGEASRGVRLVHGRVAQDVRVAFGHCGGIRRELLGELRIQQIGSGRAAAVVHEAGDRFEAQSLHLSQGLIEKLPRLCRGEVLPMQGRSQRADAERGNQLQILTNPGPVT